jgi:hypothetical protein
MILISHRGNISGPNPKLENTISYIEQAITQGFDVEIDVCKWDGEYFYLGHDEPGEAVPPSWFYFKPIWAHAKDHTSLTELIKRGIHCFWHNTDRYTLTSQGYIWAYPGEPGGENCISVHPEQQKDWKKFAGICSDNVKHYKELYDKII